MWQLRSPEIAASWLRSHITGALQTDSRLVRLGDGFLAWPGAAVDARQHVKNALERGAVVCLVESSGVDAFDFDDERIACFDNLQFASAAIANLFFRHPSLSLKVLAVTGTNGKTSTAWWLADALSNSELPTPVPSAFVGTLGVGILPNVVRTGGLTTPNPVALQSAFRHFVDVGQKACVIEASSIGIEEHRLEGTCIHTAIFTNFTQDHLDYHGNMAAYWQAKSKLFDWPGLQAAVINVDDPQGAALADKLAASTLDVWTVSMQEHPHNPARLHARDVCDTPRGMRLTVCEGNEQLTLSTQLIGTYNMANLLAVIAAMRTLGVPLVAAVSACSHLSAVPGRMECLNQDGQPRVVVDYAHTPDALAKVLGALRPLASQRGGKLWCVFGCGGDRDTSKRPLMGAIAGSQADRVVVTSDNPRSESMDAIISQILLGLEGVKNVVVEPDRANAIAWALSQAEVADVVLIAGKGHEDYQEIAGQRMPFSDRQEAQKALAQRNNPMPPVAMMTLAQVGKGLAQAQELGINAAQTITRVHTDTRTLAPGDLFVALRGEHFDANDFLSEARGKGAVAAICEGDLATTQLAQAGLPGWVVPDTRQALIQLASHWRTQFILSLVAVTGSNGKTTVTQMIASILRAWMPETFLATQGNFNNDIGVPLTVLRLRAHHQAAVVELGMNHPGEIAILSAIAQPTVALVNNAQREHLEFMRSVEAVVNENGAVIDALPADGVAVFPVDDEFSAVWTKKAGERRALRFAASHHDDADVYALQANWTGAAWQVKAATPVGELHYDLHIAGLHNVKNSLAAVACALAAQVPLPAITEGLNAFEPVKGRSRAYLVSHHGHHITLIDDSYNANPDSVRAAIDVLAALPAPRLLVLGDMGEVGDQGEQFHAEALRHALENKSTKVLVTGTALAQAAIHFESIKVYADMANLQTAVLAALPEVSSILIKGSRFMKMERLVQTILAAAQGSHSC